MHSLDTAGHETHLVSVACVDDLVVAVDAGPDLLLHDELHDMVPSHSRVYENLIQKQARICLPVHKCHMIADELQHDSVIHARQYTQDL